METVQLEIHLGYYIQEEKVRMTVEQARDLLLTAKRNKYTYAVRDDDFVELTRHSICCPHCNYKVYAYQKANTHVDDQTILTWTSQQLSLFPEKFQPLRFNQVVLDKPEFVCPKCKNTSRKSCDTRLVELQRHRHKVCVRTAVNDLAELFSSPCVWGSEISANFPLYESVWFNFNNGHTYIRLETQTGDVISTRDVTYDKGGWMSGCVYEAIRKNKYVRRVLRNMFNKEWKSAIPFYPSELGVNELRLLTTYRGYNREFYAAIPFAPESLDVEESFRGRARKMGDCYTLVSMYEQSKLPQIKSVRRIFFENPSLFFYLEEAENLWNIMQSPDYFASILRYFEIYTILSDLRNRPGIFTFLQDYAQVMGVRRLRAFIRTIWDEIYRYALEYNNMSVQMRKKDQSKWHGKELVNQRRDVPAFGIPMQKPEPYIRDCVIDDYEFFWLKNSMDYGEAGVQLHNCLGSWDPQKPAVLCVRRQGKIIAAIEVFDHRVVQARTIHNRRLYDDPGLFAAYTKWVEKNNIAGQDAKLCFDEDDFEEDVPRIAFRRHLPF